MTMMLTYVQDNSSEGEMLVKPTRMKFLNKILNLHSRYQTFHFIPFATSPYNAIFDM